jgi:hypothetical protein
MGMTTKELQVLSRCFFRLICLLLLSLPSFCNAAETTRALTVREAGATLYAQQEAESDKIATLQKGESLTPLAEAVGQERWYMVKTPWFSRLDVNRCLGRDQLKQAFKEQSCSLERSQYTRRISRHWTCDRSGG